MAPFNRLDNSPHRHHQIKSRYIIGNEIRKTKESNQTIGGIERSQRQGRGGGKERGEEGKTEKSCFGKTCARVLSLSLCSIRLHGRYK